MTEFGEWKKTTGTNFKDYFESSDGRGCLSECGMRQKAAWQAATEAERERILALIDEENE